MPAETGMTEAQRAEASKAVERLAAEHSARLYSLARRFCGSSDEAEDLVQEVFLQAFRKWHTFEGNSDPRTWLYTIAARACQRMHRKRAGEPSRIASLDTPLPFDEPVIAVVADDQDDALQQQIRKEARERVEAAIVSLPEDFRIPLVLKEIAGFTLPEVASILGLEEGTARSRVHRARLKLREAVDDALPRAPGEAPPPAYPEQTCLDLLEAKQRALDRGVPFETDVICQRCRSVFSALNVTQEACHDLAEGEAPAGLRDRLSKAIRNSARPRE
ncbi:MAG: RNA polymerase sigma factor [Phycisphaerales bacterium]